MEHPIPRRDFVSTLALGGLAFAAAPSVLRGQSVPARIKVALIGCGGRGTGALGQFIAACKLLGAEAEVVALADKVGSTERILEWAHAAPDGAVLGIGTEIHMVQRLASDLPGKTIVSLDPLICPCATMFRIDEPHLAWCLESLVRGEVVNRIEVD